ncbi:S-methyl-5-thioribose kinase [Mesorhizobium sp. M1403]|uniref:S-methyl-5-thioribose kinase n=1 Tax=Mesorhizobium sp. M1403 TaxID=2957097 RepID=UPI00333A8AF9
MVQVSKIDSQGYSKLTAQTLQQRLMDVPNVMDQVGSENDVWTVREIGDGNLNLVFIVEGSKGAVIVKQALPYVRLVGESWPLPLSRSHFEYEALIRQNERDHGRVPRVFHFDKVNAIIVMECFRPHKILRRALIDGEISSDHAPQVGRFLARTLFKSSDLAMTAAEKRADIALFSANAELCAITEELVFTEPYWAAPMNRHTSPFLDTVVADIRSHEKLKIVVQEAKRRFLCSTDVLLHGDLHTGSVMVTEQEAVVIDPEFAIYGPAGFDIGMLLGNLWISYFAQGGHADPASATDRATRILALIEAIWTHFASEWRELATTFRNGSVLCIDMFPTSELLSELVEVDLRTMWDDALIFAGAEIIRRSLGLAHNADFEDIADPRKRAICETAALRFAQKLLLDRKTFGKTVQLVNAAAEGLGGYGC